MHRAVDENDEKVWFVEARIVEGEGDPAILSDVLVDILLFQSISLNSRILCKRD